MVEGHERLAPCEAVSWTILRAAAYLPITTLAWLRAASTMERYP